MHLLPTFYWRHTAQQRSAVCGMLHVIVIGHTAHSAVCGMSPWGLTRHTALQRAERGVMTSDFASWCAKMYVRDAITETSSKQFLTIDGVLSRQINSIATKINHHNHHSHNQVTF